MDGEREHLVQEVVSGIYRASPALALTVTREKVAARVRGLIEALEREVHTTEDHDP